MATTPRDRLQRERDRITEYVDDGTFTDALGDRLHRFADTLDKDVARHTVTDDEGDPIEHEPRTVEVYLRCLRIAATDGFDLLDGSPDEFNALMDAYHDDDGKAKTTLVTYQAAARAFFRCFDCGVDPGDIRIFNPDSTPKHGVRDMFDEDEVWALRDACGQTRAPTRNRAFLELLIYTGQRATALLTLRLDDVDVDNGYIYLNDEVDGLKGALRRGRKRPMFGARKYVREWVQAHPRRGEADAWLFIGDPNHWRTDPDDHWAQVSADQVLRRIGEYAEVDKPVNAHNFRHYCATVLKRDYDLDWDTINMLFGVVEGSSMPQTTYAHLSDAEFIDRAETAMGYAEDESANRFAPPVCPTCAEVLKPDWRECPNCRELFAPDGRERQASAIDDLADTTIDDARTPAERRAVAAALKAVRREG